MWSEVLGVPTTKSLDVTTLVSYVLPPLVLYFIMAVMAITPQTRILRVATWPVLALSALRAALCVDIEVSDTEETYHTDLASPMLFLVTCSLYWALVKEPLVRLRRPANNTPSTLMDALDLIASMRGHGWNWSCGLYVAPETRPSGRTRFVSHVALSMIIHVVICGTSYRAIRSFSPLGLDSVVGGSIFDETLPFHLRYLRSSIITLIGGLTAYSIVQIGNDLYSIIGVLVFGQSPAQWPPSLDAPWRATSLSEFWGRRWHQWLRHLFLIQGGYPLGFVFGRPGFIVGAFLSSAVYHHVMLCSLDTTSKLWRMVLGFGMMGPGILAERAFKQWTGRKVCGLAGWIWTFAWLLLWGQFIIDGFVRARLMRWAVFMDIVPPLRGLVERLVMDFDTWLHTT